ncbi:hypothetical protein [Amycolatopsis saalfeldensis]|uniref:DUF1453 domain-containing protein n=1 Tax=Amycolatopsis saalfeldensis TaxID=394193 RepID=A0A1H8YLE7_9PSEU|nr:hypothetical protein [Amycolatopsis saalfeldensis]SEP52990.1 hypothetical protein SAMN04489732_123117 [Amycolatopsis saalfeldensis]
MSPATVLLYVAIAALVIYRVIYRQLRGTLLSRKGLMLMPLILVAIGVFTALQALPRASAGELALLGVDIVVLGALGALRSATTTLTRSGNTTFQKGSALTLVLWLATIAVRVGFGFLGGTLGVSGALTSSTIMLTLGISIAVQNGLTYLRIQRLGLPLADQDRRSVNA